MVANGTPVSLKAVGFTNRSPVETPFIFSKEDAEWLEKDRKIWIVNIRLLN